MDVVLILQSLMVHLHNRELSQSSLSDLDEEKTALSGNGASPNEIKDAISSKEVEDQNSQISQPLQTSSTATRPATIISYSVCSDEHQNGG